MEQVHSDSAVPPNKRHRNDTTVPRRDLRAKHIQAVKVHRAGQVTEIILAEIPVASNKQVKGQRLLSTEAEWCLRENLSVVHGRRRMKA